MLGLLVLVVAANYGLACADLLYPMFGVSLVCGRAGLIEIAVMANQGVYKIAPRSKAVRDIKALQIGTGEAVVGS